MSTKDDQLEPSGPSIAWSSDFVRHADGSRERARNIGESKRETLKELETRLTERLQKLAEELEQELARTQETAREQARQAGEVEKRAAELGRLDEYLLARRRQWEELQAENAERQAGVFAELHEKHKELEEQQDALASQARQLHAERSALDCQKIEMLADFERQRIEIEAAAARDVPQDSETAELRAQRTFLQERLVEAERLLAEQANASADESKRLEDLRRQIDQTAEALRDDQRARRQQWEQLQAQAAEQQAAALAALVEKHNVLDDRHETLARQSQQLLEERHAIERQKAEMLADVERRRAEIEASATSDVPQDAEVAELRAQRTFLQERLVEAERLLAERTTVSVAESQRLEELKRQFEQAAAALREDQLARQRQWERLQAEAAERQAAALAGLVEKHNALDERQEELALHSQQVLEERHGLERHKAEMLADFERRRAEFEANVAKGLPADAEFEELRAERQRLQERLTEAEERLAERPAIAAAETLRLEELRAQFEQTTETLKKDHLARLREWEKLQAQASERQAAALADLIEKHNALDERQEELALHSQQLLEERLAERPAIAAAEALRLEELRAQFEQTAETLKKDHLARLREWEKSQAQAAEQQAAALAELVAKHNAHDKRQAELAQHSQQVLEERHGLERQKAAMLADIERRRAEFEANVAKGLPVDAEFEELRKEHQRLQERLADAEARLAERPAIAAAEALRLEELRCQLELTAEALREDQLARQREWERLQTEAAARQAAALAELVAKHHELSQCQEGLARESRQLLNNQHALELQKVEMQAELERQRAELVGAAQHDSSLDTALAAELEELRIQRKRLQERLAEAERELEERPADDGADSRQLEELRRRFEMAVEDLRDSKNEIEELKRELDAARRPGSNASSPGPASLGTDWESQKKRLMQQLEDGFDGSPSKAQAAEDKLTVEGAIRITDQMVVEKEREIQELKRLLDDQSSNIGGLAVGATAIAAVLDQDELIREERESLKRVQDEWREKLRKAEVDISLERAKLARDRAELEEKLQRHAANTKHDVPGDASGDKSKKPRRWLSMLVKESEEK